MSNHFVRHEQSGNVLTLTLDRPKANAFDFEMVGQLLSAFAEARGAETVRCVVLTGAGRFFSSGQDLTVILDQGDLVRYKEHLRRTYNAIVLAMRELEKPIVAAINGPAAGAGLGIALAADIRWASDTAKFIFGFSEIGLVADSGVSLTLPLLVGLGKASEMAFTNEALDAREALLCGLVTRVLPAGELMREVDTLAAQITSRPPRALGLTKRAFNRAYLHNLPAVLEYESQLQQIAGETLDHHEGLQAFVEKRPGKFTGR